MDSCKASIIISLAYFIRMTISVHLTMIPLQDDVIKSTIDKNLKIYVLKLTKLCEMKVK